MPEEKELVPDEITEEFINELAKKISPQGVRFLNDAVFESNRGKLRDRIKNQMGSQEDVFEQFSLNQYYQLSVEISPHLRAVFRTLTTCAQDELIKFGREKSEGFADSYTRIVQKRRLSYGVIEINGRTLSGVPVNGSYLEKQLGNMDVEAELKKMADEAYDKFAVLPEPLVTRLAEAYIIWEGLVYDTVDSIESLDELAKNSTRTPQSAPSAQ
jgi:hypothetical protein